MAKTTKETLTKGSGTAPEGGKKITAKQALFIQAFLLTGNATESARQAGFSHPNTQGPYLVNLRHVRAEIDKRRAESEKATVMTRQQRLERLSAIARDDADRKHAIQAMKLISQMNGELVQRTEVSGLNGGPIQTQALQDLPLQELTCLLDKSDDT
jgi:hypothetical protein